MKGKLVQNFCIRKGCRTHVTHRDITTALDKVAKAYNWTKLEDFYKLTPSILRQSGVSWLLSGERSNFVALLQSAYPKHDWIPWKFETQVPRGYWQSFAARRQFIEWLGRELKINDMEEWYNVSSKQIIDAGGRGLLSKHFQDSRAAMLASCFPEHTFHPWKFSRHQVDWTSSSIQRSYVEWLYSEFKYTKMDDWYATSRQKLEQTVGGRHILKIFRSVDGYLKAMYPAHPWDISLFAGGDIKLKRKRLPTGYWDDIENQRQALDNIAKRLKLKTMDDWYKVSNLDIRSQIGAAFVGTHYTGSLHRALKTVYSEHGWIAARFHRTAEPGD